MFALGLDFMANSTQRLQVGQCALTPSFINRQDVVGLPSIPFDRVVRQNGN
jgi:hypothetical protein